MAEDTKTIGIVGAGANTGVTHLAILTANYMTGVCRLKTAVLEWNRHGDFEHMEQICVGRISACKPFNVLDVDYYKDAGTEELLLCARCRYDKIIIDFGGSWQCRTEFLRCNKKIVLGSLSEWQLKRYLELMEEIRCEADYKSWIYGITFGSEETRLELEKRLSLTLTRVPLSVDSFQVNYETIRYLEQVF